jgi:hypothetical protein
MSDQGDFSIVRFSTDDLPEKDRAAIWCEHFAPSVFKVEVEPPPPDTPLHVDMTARSLPGLQLLSGLYTPGRMLRTRRLIADDGNDDFILRINTSGHVIVSAAGREVDHGCGAILTNAAEASLLDRPTFGGSTVVRIPRSILSPLVCRRAGSTGRNGGRESDVELGAASRVSQRPVKAAIDSAVAEHQSLGERLSGCWRDHGRRHHHRHGHGPYDRTRQEGLRE